MAPLQLLSIAAAACATLGVALTFISAKWPDPEPHYGSAMERRGFVILLMFAGCCIVAVSLVLTIAAGLVAVLT